MDYANIILEMLDRIKKLEAEVQRLKGELESNESRAGGNYGLNKDSSFNKLDTFPSKRDTTRYMFNGNVYLKNRLVLAVVQKYVQENSNISREELVRVFSRTLQGSLGVVEYVEIASRKKDCDVRFFTKENEIIRLLDGDMYVCSQWGILNIPNFLKAAEQLGYTIEPI